MQQCPSISEHDQPADDTAGKSLHIGVGAGSGGRRDQPPRQQQGTEIQRDAGKSNAYSFLVQRAKTKPIRRLVYQLEKASPKDRIYVRLLFRPSACRLGAAAPRMLSTRKSTNTRIFGDVSLEGWNNKWRGAGGGSWSSRMRRKRPAARSAPTCQDGTLTIPAPSFAADTRASRLFTQSRPAIRILHSVLPLCLKRHSPIPGASENTRQSWRLKSDGDCGRPKRFR